MYCLPDWSGFGFAIACKNSPIASTSIAQRNTRRHWALPAALVTLLFTHFAAATPGNQTPVAMPTVNQADVNASDQIGAINSTFKVDSSGAAVYEIPILAVQGTAGVTPKYSLHYSSQGGNGLVGQGWSEAPSICPNGSPCLTPHSGYKK